ncbi:MerR family transcriptional regulator [Corynebacterium yudongzhengii]|uniref:MerR family DNA-binding transcriptional regulator n=1 Tax=Corynebacterium yudongzhengii TaxID=2080740 RepID=A0A2U1T4Z5_9CORY|nr:helix-turn-helix transcriptional regulator [Corynebacterium yudongzhengii]AWB82715.1 MerR family transcriptional regulator [Corynebacterium yudongzhengii]PWC00958.1 MerR family DNA-binding transcriptional regulator [Corynebacterium yudongzhengii]
MSSEDDASGEVYVISVAADLTGMHAQTLRTYDRIGLVVPQRTSGGGRRYTRRDLDLLREIQRLSQDDGVNLAGIKEIIRLNEENAKLRDELDRTRAELAEAKDKPANAGRELVHVPRSTAVVMWDRRRRRRPEM